MAFGAAGLIERRLGFHGRTFGIGNRLLGDLDHFALLVRIGKSGNAIGDLREFAGGFRHLALKAGAALGEIADGAFQLVAAGGGFGALGGQPCEITFAVGKGCGCGLEGFLCLFAEAAGIGEDFLEFGLFFRQPLDDLGIFRDQALLAANVLVELGETAGEFVAAAQNPVGFLVQLRAGDLQTLQGCGGLRLLLAQFRHLEACHGLKLCRLHLVVRLFGDRRHGLVQGAFRLAFRLLGLRPANVQEHGIMGADIGRQLLEAVRLTGLAFQAFDLAFELGGDVFERSRLVSAARSLSSASWRRECRPEMPAASSSNCRRAWGLAWISSPMRP